MNTWSPCFILIRGELTINAEVLSQTRNLLAGDFYCRNLKTNSVFSFASCSPFFVIERICGHGTVCKDPAASTNDAQWVKVFESSVIRQKTDPLWPTITIPLAILCNGDVLRRLRICVFAHDTLGAHKLIGRVETCLDDLITNTNRPISIIDPNKVQLSRKLSVYCDDQFLCAGAK
jgi:hypothetical protein